MGLPGTTFTCQSPGPSPHSGILGTSISLLPASRLPCKQGVGILNLSEWL